MKEVIPGVGDRKASKRLDELFSRKTLGAVLFGAAVSKIIEKANMIAVSLVILFAFDVEITNRVMLTAILLLLWWFIELLIFTYLYIKWEKTVEALAEEATKATEKTKQATYEVKGIGRKKPDYEFDVSLFGKSLSCAISFSNKDGEDS